MVIMVKVLELLKVTSPLMYGEDVRAVQNKLNSLGYNAGTADGYYGNGTRTAVIKFQTDRGLDTDGDVGPTTWSALFNTSISGGNNYSRILKVTSPLMYGEDVRAVQNKLNSLGYNAGTADGYYGEGTRTAVINFQTARGLDIDGEVGPNTWNTLFNTSSSGGNGVTSNIRKVFIDPGHGGTDPGASGNGLYEKEVVLSIAKKVRNILISKGFDVELSRSTDPYVSLSDRAAQANAWDADLFVSIHCNSATSSSANGTECYTHPTANTSTKSLSKNMASALASKLSLTNRGHKEANFTVLRLSNMPSILIETAFINNENDATKLKTRENDFASAIANQIANTSIDSSTGGSSNGNTSAEYSRNLEVTSPKLKTRENDFASAIANQIANTSIDSSTGGSSNGNTSAEYSRNLEVTSPLMYGEDIKAVQNKLNSLGFNCGAADGYYGNDTKNAVIKFQIAFGITADGIVGPTTWMYLFETNASVEDILKVAGNIGLFSNSTLTFMDLKNPTPEVRVSLYPAIYLKGELGINQSLSSSTSNGIINLSLSPKTISSNIIKDLSTVNITHNIDKDTLAESIEKLTAIQKIGDTMTYSISVTNLGEIELKLEAYIPANTEISYEGTTIKLGSKIYQRLIITIRPDYLPVPSVNGLKTQITVPLYKKNIETNDNVESDTIMTAIMIAAGVTLLVSVPTIYVIINSGPLVATATTFIINLLTQFYSKVFG